MNRETLIIIAIILTALIALPLWRVVALSLMGRWYFPFITAVILLAVFGMLLILATNRETLSIIAVILTVLIALPLWRVVALFLWNDGIISLIIALILLAVFGTILILAAKISNSWLVGAVWTAIIALFAGFPIYSAISGYYYDHHDEYIFRKFERSVENGAPDNEIRRLSKKIKSNFRAFEIFVRNSRFDLVREMFEKGKPINGHYGLLSRLSAPQLLKSLLGLKSQIFKLLFKTYQLRNKLFCSCR